MLKKTLLAAACAALAACGGDDRPDPASRTFTYGAAVTPTFEEQAAADDGSFLLSDGATYRSTGDAVAAETASGSLPSLPDDMASYLFAGSAVAGMTPGGATAKRVAGALGSGLFTGQALGEGFDDPNCVDPGPGQVVYRGCTITMVDTTSTMTVRVDGTFSRTADVFAWDATIGMTMTDVEMRMTATNRLYGSFTFGAASIAGRARSDAAVTVSAQGQSMRAGWTTIADLDLDYAVDPTFCVTGGTLELRRVWTQRAAGMPTDGEYADQGVKFEWLGCGQVLVSRGR